ncbi:MAG: helix-turn-helix transcriptional regulator [Oscillospiraceae bacterium]|nr:helix-turn-helix transcriptional regulator [Oscillospiraceae bacterium]
MKNEDIGARIESRRRALGLTLDDIAQEIGVAKSTVYRYEKGTIDKIKMPVIEAIARVLKVNPSWICCKTDDMDEKPPALTEKDERDIAKDLERIMAQLDAGGDLMFDGDPMSDEAKESIRAAMRLGLEAAKMKNKERFTPKQYRKE